MILHCPVCGTQHIDAPEPSSAREGDSPIVAEAMALLDGPLPRWTNPPHRSHLCHLCKYVWRPADVPTNGVAEIKTKGKNDSPMAVSPMLTFDLTMDKITSLAKIRGLLGYVENDSATPVTISQDDATMDFSLRIGRPSDPWTKVYYMKSLKGVIDAAYKAQGEVGNDQG